MTHGGRVLQAKSAQVPMFRRCSGFCRKRLGKRLSAGVWASCGKQSRGRLWPPASVETARTQLSEDFSKSPRRLTKPSPGEARSQRFFAGRRPGTFFVINIKRAAAGWLPHPRAYRYDMLTHGPIVRVTCKPLLDALFDKRTRSTRPRFFASASFRHSSRLSTRCVRNSGRIPAFCPASTHPGSMCPFRR